MTEGTVVGIIVGGVITVINGFLAYMVSRDKGRFDMERERLRWEVESLNKEVANLQEAEQACQERSAVLEKKIEDERKTCNERIDALQKQIDELHKRSGG